MKYTERSKREELFDPATRFLLCLTPGVASPVIPGALPPSSSRRKGKGKAEIVDLREGQELVGYCSFRFDTEETLGTRDAEVIYWFVHSHRIRSRLIEVNTLATSCN